MKTSTIMNFMGNYKILYDGTRLRTLQESEAMELVLDCQRKFGNYTEGQEAPFWANNMFQFKKRNKPIFGT